MFTMPGGQQICQGAANAWQPFLNKGHPTTGAATGSLSAEPGSTLGGDVWSSAASTTEDSPFAEGSDASSVASSAQEDTRLGVSQRSNEDRRRRRLHGFSAASLGGRSGPSCEPDAPVKARQACMEQRALQRCSAEEKYHRKLPPGTEGPAVEVARCLKDMRLCNATLATLREGALMMKGFRLLADKRPACLAHNAGAQNP
eukprot:CAMPEP_0198221480 /NCGR_PEP_ID=MMETSP1445-20131203/83950_1 /TAXON_ID=36898 /ORGANISM="Pyramimonas sp., Strain CCMP2087" /LENGTH=200 /DNA_ID=CAMNT_0043899661 /DNA_START=335 /DNA_END=934 /DNA_ORIENTATION=-